MSMNTEDALAEFQGAVAEVKDLGNLFDKSDANDCPRCGGGVPNDEQRGAYPGALSRWDNETEVCSQCGTDEAMIQLMAHLAEADPQFAVRPEARPWVRIPA